MSEIIKSIQQTDIDITSCHKRLEELTTKRQEDVVSMTIMDAVSLVNQNRAEDSCLYIRLIKETAGEKSGSALLYTKGSFSVGFLLGIKSGESFVNESSLRSKEVGILFASEGIQSPRFSFCDVYKGIEEDLTKICEGLEIKVLVTWRSSYDLKYSQLQFEPKNTDLLNPIWKSQGSFLEFDELCSKLDTILSHNMPGKEFRKIFTNTIMYCKLIERKSVNEVARIAKISHYEIATGKKTEESFKLQPEKPTTRRREHLSPSECWAREVEHRQWDKDIGHEWH